MKKKSIGGITYKTINGKRYAYYQWMENGKQRARRVKDFELADLSEEIARRRAVSRMHLRECRAVYGEAIFKTDIKKGLALRSFSVNVARWKKREAFALLDGYIYGKPNDRVFILYGLRRTGKTTLIRQVLGEMSDENLSRAAFIQVNSKNTLADLNFDLKILAQEGFKYIFIDEVTMLADFIEGAALFSDIFASDGMKIVLSGTDSLGFVFSEDEQLYDRAEMLHTTFIPYREFERVLGIKGIDEYIQYGGTMSMGGSLYNKNRYTFVNIQSTNEYVDSAIARNIQHSLKCYRSGGHFRSLRNLYDNRELTNVINRIVESINRRFAMDVLIRDFKSGDLGISARNLRKDRTRPSDILDRVNISKITSRLRKHLELLNARELQTQITQDHVREIREYFDLLDLTKDIDIENFSNFDNKDVMTVIAQPGLRYAQAKALVESLLKDNTFRNLSLAERNSVVKRILDEIKGRMMEEIVLLETSVSKKDCHVFKLQFAVGEFDMVVANPLKATCEIFEIKHSDVVAKEQYRHLKNAKKCRDTEFRYGRIESKNVIYRGQNMTQDGIRYLNVEEYLKSLS